MLMIFGISLILITLHFYNKQKDKDVIEGFSTMSNIKVILKFPFVILGKIELSTTLSFFTPITLHFSSTTAKGSLAEPILHVPQGW